MSYNTAITTLLIYWSVVIAGVIGWTLNLIELVSMLIAGSPVTAMLIARIVGVPVFILGAVLGYF